MRCEQIYSNGRQCILPAGHADEHIMDGEIAQLAREILLAWCGRTTARLFEAPADKAVTAAFSLADAFAAETKRRGGLQGPAETVGRRCCRKRDRIDALEKALRECQPIVCQNRCLRHEVLSTSHVVQCSEARAALAGEKAVCPICDGGPGNDCACTCPKESAAPAPVADDGDERCSACKNWIVLDDGAEWPEDRSTMLCNSCAQEEVHRLRAALAGEKP